MVKGVKSDAYVIIAGVPLGSCIGPLLFLAYVNDIGDYSSLSHILKYADDIKI